MKKLLILLCLLLSVPMFADEYSDYKNKMMLESLQTVSTFKRKSEEVEVVLSKETAARTNNAAEYTKLYQEYCDYRRADHYNVSFKEFITNVKHLDYNTVISWRSTN